MRFFILLLSLSFLAACSAPKPKTVSGNNRVPINSTPIEIPQPQVKPEPAFIAQPPKPAVFVFNFDWERTNLVVPNDALVKILPLALHAQKIQLRGRTDNTKESVFDEGIAKGRAIAARDFLIEKGVDPKILFVNYSSASDYVSENVTPEGRARNRRVEIVIFNNYTEL